MQIEEVVTLWRLLNGGKENVESVDIGRYCIIRTQSAGVHAGVLVSERGDEVRLRDARRLWYWDGAASLSELAVRGPGKPQNCKFPTAVSEITLKGVIEVIPTTPTAEAAIKAVPEWTSN